MKIETGLIPGIAVGVIVDRSRNQTKIGIAILCFTIAFKFPRRK